LAPKGISGLEEENPGGVSKIHETHETAHAGLIGRIVVRHHPLRRDDA